MTIAPLAITSGSAEDAATIEKLNATVSSLETDRQFYLDRLDRAKADHRADIARIGNKLMEEAEDRGWCSEYDDIVDDLNRNLSVELPTRSKDYTVTVRLNVEITVDAQSEEGARSAAHDIARRLERDLDSNENVLSNWDSDDEYEIEES
jgi:hypothetical protein